MSKALLESRIQNIQYKGMRTTPIFILGDSRQNIFLFKGLKSVTKRYWNNLFFEFILLVLMSVLRKANTVKALLSPRGGAYLILDTSKGAY